MTTHTATVNNVKNNARAFVKVNAKRLPAVHAYNPAIAYSKEFVEQMAEQERDECVRETAKWDLGAEGLHFSFYNDIHLESAVRH